MPNRVVFSRTEENPAQVQLHSSSLRKHYIMGSSIFTSAALLLGIFVVLQGIEPGESCVFTSLCTRVRGRAESAYNLARRVSRIPGNVYQKARGWPWCDDNLGCLDVTDGWYSTTWRPLNMVPHRRNSIRTRFFVHTRESRNRHNNQQVVAYEPWTLHQQEGFDPIKPTKFIIHGFADTGYTKWLKEFAQELLDYGDYNVFRVDWGGGSRALYSDAVANTRVVGLEIGYLVNWMIREFGVDPAKVHLIGHSLGAQISGYAGEKIFGLGRISGLDPAGPYFTNMPTYVRLDTSDAIFVDNYHTDGAQVIVLGYGTSQPMGHLDFYPNGGRAQPGCDPVTTSIFALRPGNLRDDAGQLLGCSHLRAITLYRDSLVQSCLAIECADYGAFSAGECRYCGDNGERCSQFGIRASEYTQKRWTNVKMYLDTHAQAPFCLE